MALNIKHKSKNAGPSPDTDLADHDVPAEPAVADATGGATIDAEARTAINTLLARLRNLGLIEP